MYYIAIKAMFRLALHAPKYSALPLLTRNFTFHVVGITLWNTPSDHFCRSDIFDNNFSHNALKISIDTKPVPKMVPRVVLHLLLLALFTVGGFSYFIAVSRGQEKLEIKDNFSTDSCRGNTDFFRGLSRGENFFTKDLLLNPKLGKHLVQ